MAEPGFLDDPAFKSLRAGDLDAYHQAIRDRDVVDFSGTNLRGVDFRAADISKLVLRDAYLRDADLRGCDLRHLDLRGASLQGARISGTYFPDHLPAAEIRMSVELGTRIRAPNST